MICLGVDIGTTGLKMGVYIFKGNQIHLSDHFSSSYPINVYNQGLFGDIEPVKWQKAFIAGCRYLKKHLDKIDVISLSGTTPGLLPMDNEGTALYPAILMLDQRSRLQAQHIIDVIGLDNLLNTTGNMPVAGGCSLASILWLKENEPNVFQNTHIFGHSNTFMSTWLTGKPAIDPSSASLTALYNTVENDLTWNKDIAGAFEIPLEKLPPVIPSWASPGSLSDKLARDLGFKKKPPVVIGGNDAVLAAFSVGINKPGQILNVNGTCEITLVCLSKCLPSTQYNIRAHVLPDRWLTLYVMNAGGKALEWFKTLFCSEMDDNSFYNDFIPTALEPWLDRENRVTYIPYLMGSRYSQTALTAELLGLTQTSTREQIFAALIRGLCQYQKEHLKDIAIETSLDKIIHITGGALNHAIIKAKNKWMRSCEYIYEEQSSMKGAAMLGEIYLNGGKFS